MTLTGVVGPDGYVLDFGEIKKISRVISKDLDESFLVPMNSDVLKVQKPLYNLVKSKIAVVFCRSHLMEQMYTY